MISNSLFRNLFCIKLTKCTSILFSVIVLSVVFIVCWEITPAPLEIRYVEAASLAFSSTHSYVAVRDKGIFAISYQDGEIAWQYPEDRTSSVQMMVNSNVQIETSKLYFTAGEELFALSAIDGSLLWKLHLDIEATSNIRIQALPGRLLLANLASGSLYLVDTSQGELVWVFNLPINASHQILPLSFSLERVVIIAGDIQKEEGSYIMSGGQLYVISTSSGDILWTYDLEDWITASSIFVPVAKDVEGTVYLLVERNILALDGDSGTIKWHTFLQIGTYDHLFILADTVFAVGPTTMVTLQRVSGVMVCRNPISPSKDVMTNDFLVQDAKNVYFIRHEIKPRRILWWTIPQSVERTYLYVIAVHSCESKLLSTTRGRLLNYDPVTGKGVHIRDIFDDLTDMQKIQVRP